MIFAAMNAIKMVFFWIVSIVCANKNKIKGRLQYTNKKLSLPGDKIIYAPEEDLEMK